MKDQTERKRWRSRRKGREVKDQTERKRWRSRRKGKGGGGADGKEKVEEEQVPELSDICWCAARP